MKNPNSRTMTISVKVAAHEKMRYHQKATSHDISLSEWAASILSMYQNDYGELKISSYREEELLNEINKLKKNINLLEALIKFKDTQIASKLLGFSFHL